MTKYGFVIDNRRCIGCYACTVACKTEHDDPIGTLAVNDDDVFRTVFRGRFTPAETEGEQWRLASETTTKIVKTVERIDPSDSQRRCTDMNTVKTT